MKFVGNSVPSYPSALAPSGASDISDKAYTDTAAGEIYNAKLLGAKGDNSTNDRSTLQSIIDSVPSTGGTLYLGPGTYVIDAALNVKDNLTIRGAGSNVTTIKQITQNVNCLAGVDINNFTLEDIGLQGPNAGTSGDGLILSRSSAANTAYISMKDVYIRQFKGDGIDISNCIVSVFQRVNCENNGQGWNIHGDSGVAGTSVTFLSCYANTNTTNGFNISTMAYSTMVGCASEGHAINFLLTGCQGITLIACGSEVMQAGGTGYKVDGGFGVKLDSCWDYVNRNIAFHFTGSHLNGTIQNCVENSPSGATSAIRVESGCKVFMTQNSYTTSRAIFGLAPQFEANVGVMGTLYFGNLSDAYLYRTAANNIANDGVFTQWTEPTSSEHVATKNYVDTQNGTRLKGRKAADQTGISSTSYTDVTNLSVTLPTTGYYRFKAFIPFRAVSGTSPTITFGVTGPTAVSCQYNVAVQTATAGTASNFTAGAYLQNTNQSGAVTTGTTYGAVIDGYVEVSATGTLKVQCKAGGTTPSFTVFTGAIFLVEKISF